MGSNWLSNCCPKCGQGLIVERVFALKQTCDECGYIFAPEHGAFTGVLYLNLMIIGLSTFPFFLLLFIPDVNIAGIAVMTILWILFLTPLSLRYSKIVWTKMLFKQSAS